MCELFAYTSKSPYVLNDILSAFYQRAKYHPHGWGQIVLDSKTPKLMKEPVNALKSKILPRILDKEIKSQSLLAHIRYATTGAMKYDNTHPFENMDKTGRRWVLIHNGTIFRDEIIAPYVNVQKGNTDSERILLLIIDTINKTTDALNRPLTQAERFELINGLVSELSKGNNKLNLIIHDGEQLYIHSNGYNQMYQAQLGDGTLFCTRALEIPGLEWKSVPRMTVLGYQDGELKNYGDVHGNAYIPDPEVEAELIKKYAYLS